VESAPTIPRRGARLVGGLITPKHTTNTTKTGNTANARLPGTSGDPCSL
jgi:hypothetical protein